jgi:hypothetical protein
MTIEIGLQVTVGGVKALDHRKVLRQMSRRPHWAGKVGTIWNPAGVRPGEAFFLFPDTTIGTIDSSATKIDIVATQTVTATGTTGDYLPASKTFSDYLMVDAYPATDQDNGPWVAHFKDRRLLYQESGAVREIYSISGSSGGAQSGNKVSWSTMYDAIWALIPDSPTKPTFGTPGFTPNWIDWIGRPAVDLACLLHALLGKGLTYQVSDGEFALFDFDTTQSAYQTLVGNKLFMGAISKSFRNRTPNRIEVLFPQIFPADDPYRKEQSTGSGHTKRFKTIWGFSHESSTQTTTKLDDEADDLIDAWEGANHYEESSGMDRIPGWVDLDPGPEVSSVKWGYTPSGVPCTDIYRIGEYELPLPHRTEYNRGATRLIGALNGAMATTDASKSVDGLEAIDGFLVDWDSLTVNNDGDWEGDDNAWCLIELAADGNWHFYQLACP